MEKVELLKVIIFGGGMIWFLASLSNIENEITKIRRITENNK